MKKVKREEKRRAASRFTACMAVFTAVAICAAICVAGWTALKPLRALAAESGEDRTLSLTVELTYDGEPIEGVEVCLFYVGSLSGDDLVPEGRFADYAVTAADEDDAESDWDGLALTLAGYSYLDALEPEEKCFTDAEGNAYFPQSGETLKEGVYLVLTQTFEQDDVTYATQPFLIALPDVESDQIYYQVVAEPKVTERTGSQRFTVLKIWEDEDADTRPDSVDVSLVNDEGTVYGTVTLSAKNSWRYVFTGLPDGCTWYVVEEVPDGYTVLQSADGNTIALTNTADEGDEPGTTSQDTTTPSDDGTTAGDDVTTAADGGTSGDGTTTAADGGTSGDGTTTTADDGTSGGGATTAADGSSDGTTTKSGDAEETTTVLTKLPQTGTLWWLVPILACCGMVSVLIGVAKKRAGDENE